MECFSSNIFSFPRLLNSVISVRPFLKHNPHWKLPAVKPENQISLISIGKCKNPPHFVMCEKFLKGLKPKGQPRLWHPKDPNSESLWLKYSSAAHLCYAVFQQFLQLPSHSIAVIEHGQSLGPTILVLDRRRLSTCIPFFFFSPT